MTSICNGCGSPHAWPPQMPDLIPFNFYLCEYMKGLAYHEISHTENKELLKNIIVSTADIEEWSWKHTEIDNCCSKRSLVLHNWFKRSFWTTLHLSTTYIKQNLINVEVITHTGLTFFSFKICHWITTRSLANVSWEILYTHYGQNSYILYLPTEHY